MIARKNPTLYALINEHNDGNPDTTAEAVWRATHCPAKWRALFFPLVRDECRRRIRGVVRFLEQHPDRRAEAIKVAQPIDPPPRSLVGVPDLEGDRKLPINSRRAFLSERFYTGVKYVAHGEATIEDHEGRIAFQLELRGGIDDDIVFHWTAIELIQRTGVTCLNEVPDVDLDELAA